MKRIVMTVSCLAFGACVGSAGMRPAPVAPQSAGAPPPAAPPEIAAAPAAAPAPLTLDSLAEGELAPGELRRHPFSIDTPKHGSYYGDGLYQIELIVRAPPGTGTTLHCAAAPYLELKVIDRDDAVVDSHGVGDGFSAGTWDESNGSKRTGQFDFARGSYRVSLLAGKDCRVRYRLRLAAAAKR